MYSTKRNFRKIIKGGTSYMTKLKEQKSRHQSAEQEYTAWEAIYEHIKECPASMKKEIIKMLMEKLIIFRKE
jgi:hypothetical protein